nr:hypothetical protein [Bacteroidota bacterium]
MIYNRFYFQILFRSFVLAITSLVFALLVIETSRFFTIIFFGLLFMAEIIWIIRYLNTTNRNLAKFLLFLQENDTSLAFSKENVEKTFKGLHHSFNEINEGIRNLRIQREQKSQQLKFVINHLKVAIIAFSDQGQIELINNAALKLFAPEEAEGISNLNRLDENLLTFLKGLMVNRQEIFHHKPGNPESQQFSSKASEFKLGDQVIKLVSLQNITPELEQKEVESWHKLIHVLAHEISNSLTPITSLGHNITKRMEKYMPGTGSDIQLPEKTGEEIVRSANLISERGMGLIEFVKSYKSYAVMPEPDMQTILISKLIENTKQYFNETLTGKNILFNSVVVPPYLVLRADKKLTDQMIINLIGNSIQALDGKENASINILAYVDAEKDIILEISDNGHGIPKDVLDKVFIPFFTTREKGTGIGLSISKNIMHLHKGSIRINSEQGEGTKVTLKFHG